MARPRDPRVATYFVQYLNRVDKLLLNFTPGCRDSGLINSVALPLQQIKDQKSRRGNNDCSGSSLIAFDCLASKYDFGLYARIVALLNFQETSQLNIHTFACNRFDL